MTMRSWLYLLLQRMIGSRTDLAWRSLHRQSVLDPASYAAEHQATLKQTLAAAIRDIPFYQNHRGLDASRLDSFPILTKEALSKNYNNLMSTPTREEYEGRKRRSAYGWVEVRSGGTTGVPSAVIHGPDFRDHDRALRMLQMKMCGFPFGVPYVRLWGSMTDINRMRESLTHRVMSTLGRETIINAFRMETGDMDRHLDFLERHRVRYLMAYIDAAEALAHHALSGGRRLQIDRVMACAGTVTEGARRAIREAFSAQVHNKYGSRDAGEMACECQAGGLHILPGVEIEVVDDAYQPVPPGQTGRLLITCLHNRVFPIIRYDIGDIGARGDVASCPCGLPFPLLKRLEGRVVEVLRSTRGGFVSPVYIRHLVGVVHPPTGLRRYQIEQRAPSDYVLRLVRDPAVQMNNEDYTNLTRDLLAVLGHDANVTILEVTEIPSSSSGKFQYIISRLPRAHEDTLH